MVIDEGGAQDSTQPTQKSCVNDKRRLFFSRRSFLKNVGYGAAAGAGAALAVAATHAAAHNHNAGKGDSLYFGQEAQNFYGKYQQGIDISPQSYQRLIAFNLKPGMSPQDLKRLLKILTSDIERLSSGAAALADSEPELAHYPSNLTVTCGFGQGFIEIIDRKVVPYWLKPLPAYKIDRLIGTFDRADFCLQIAADNFDTVVHAARMLSKDSRTFATLAWIQDGFRRNRNVTSSAVTQRNLLGQIDGTSNLAPGTDRFYEHVFIDDTTWLAHGSSLVVRRIEFLLDKWDAFDRPGREQAVGRTVATGAPLTGKNENDDPDFEAKNTFGFPVIQQYAHIRRVRAEKPDEVIYRRSYNYDMDPTVTPNTQGAYGKKISVSNSGMIFTSYQKDPLKQFHPLQQRMAAGDLLNEWAVPIGSAVFAIAPGPSQGGYIGETLCDG